MLLALGRRGEALEAYQKSLANSEKLAAADPGNTELLRDLTIGYEKVGDVLTAFGRHDEALTNYRKELPIMERLLAADSGNAEWQRDLAVTYERLGDVLVKLGRRAEALEAHRKCLAIRERLTAADPGNAQWQGDLIISLFRLAGLGDDSKARLVRALELTQQLDRAGKLAADQKGWLRLISQELAKFP